MSETKHGYANFKRAELLKFLKPFLGRIKNISTGIEANLSKKSFHAKTIVELPHAIKLVCLSHSGLLK